MIKNFGQWNENDRLTAVNESVVSSLLKSIFKGSTKSVDDMLKSGFKGVANLTRKLFGASVDEISKIEKKLSDVIASLEDPLIKGLSKKARKALEKEADEVTKKYLAAYHSGNAGEISRAREAGDEYLKRVLKIKDARKYIEDLKLKNNELPTRRLRNEFDDSIKSAEDALDDAVKTGDMSRIDDARKFVEGPAKFFKDAGRGRSYAGSSSRRYARGYTSEPGSNLADDAIDALKKKGKDGIEKDIDDVGKKSLTGKQKIWKGFKKILKYTLTFSAIVYGGGVALEFLRRNEEEEAKESIERSLETVAEDFFKNGIEPTKVDMNKASFSEAMMLFFAGQEGDLPVDDASELKTMFKAGSTMADFFAKTSQLCFEYPKKYFSENESKMKEESSFYGFVHALDDKVKVSEIVESVMAAEGDVSDALEESFYKDGSPVSLGEYGYISYANPNMKILLGPNQPVSIGDLLDESEEFLKLFSQFTRKISNDFIENSVSAVLREFGDLTEEEFEERERRIQKDLEKQLSEKESSFVALTGLILSYNVDKNPFKYFYSFDDSNFYSSTDSMSNMIEEYPDLRSYRQLGRIYLSLASELSKVYDDMGKERSLYGVMEYSNFGFIMRSLMTMYALENVCKMILSKRDVKASETFAKEEVEDYQKIIIQIQKKEGLKPTVTVNGSLDDDTIEAIGSYQEKLGLPKTGKPGEKSLSKLKEYLVSIITSKED